MSEIDELRRRAEWAEGQLRARHRADAQARIDAMASEQKHDDNSGKAEREAALATEIEKMRRGTWVTELLKQAAASNPDAPFDPEKFEAAIPQTGWPAGISPSDFHFSGQHAVGNDNDDVGQTTLGRMFAEIQEGRRAFAARNGFDEPIRTPDVVLVDVPAAVLLPP